MSRQPVARVAPPVRQTAAPAPSNAPLSLSPDAPSRAAPARAAAPAARTAAVSGGAAGGYAVQVSSQRSEADAQAAFRSLQGKFPGQLGGKPSVIHKVDLGAKGTYYRAMVGPFANANEASELCSSLKAAGGQCIVQKN
ncbi:MAG TPA: SPOR domain-containing protein [Pseudolabrys sp.]